MGKFMWSDSDSFERVVGNSSLKNFKFRKSVHLRFIFKFRLVEGDIDWCTWVECGFWVCGVAGTKFVGVRRSFLWKVLPSESLLGAVFSVWEYDGGCCCCCFRTAVTELGKDNY